MVSRGFTLIELITSIILLSILAISVTSYIGFAARMYVDVSEREQLLAQSRFAIERLSRELRNATPNSVRTAGSGALQCLEFTPFVLSGLYLQAPIAPDNAEDMLLAGNEDLASLTAEDLVVIYPRYAEDIYSPASDYRAEISSSDTSLLDASEATAKVTLSNTHSFPRHSPDRRFYVLDKPVSYCVLGKQLWRYRGYPLQELQPLPPPATDRVLMAEGLNTAVLPDGEVFRYAEPVLSRNAVVSIRLNFGSSLTEDLFFHHEVQLPNVP